MLRVWFRSLGWGNGRYHVVKQRLPLAFGYRIRVLRHLPQLLDGRGFFDAPPGVRVGREQLQLSVYSVLDVLDAGDLPIWVLGKARGKVLPLQIVKHADGLSLAHEVGTQLVRLVLDHAHRVELGHVAHPNTERAAKVGTAGVLAAIVAAEVNQALQLAEVQFHSVRAVRYGIAQLQGRLEGFVVLDLEGREEGDGQE